MIPASVYIITQDCAATLRGTLASVRDFAEVVLVDSGSRDDTLAIAAEFGCQVRHQDWLGFARQKQLALELCQHDWVLNLDGDEELSDELRDEIAACIRDDLADGLDIPIHDYFLGQPPSRGGRPNRRIRFFRRALGGYDTGVEVHESVSVRGRVRAARGGIRHYGENSIAVKVAKNNHYSGLRAREKAARGKRASLLKMVLAFPLAFIKSYLLRRAFLDGRRGFINSMINGFYAFLKEAKLYERNLTGRDD